MGKLEDESTNNNAKPGGKIAKKRTLPKKTVDQRPSKNNSTTFQPAHITHRRSRPVLLKVLSQSHKLMLLGNKTYVRKLIYYVRMRNFSLILEKMRRKLHETPASHQSHSYKTRIQSNLRVDEISLLDFPRFPSLRVSIVIPVYNGWVYLYQCLKSILDHTENIPYEVIIVDDGSTDETQDVLNNVKSVRILKNSRNKGFVDSCNRGARQASGEYVVFLNSDTIVTRGWLDAMVKMADGDESIGIVGVKLIYPDGSLQEAGGIVWNSTVVQTSNFGRGDNPGKWKYNYVKDVDYCSGACLLVRNKVLIQLGYFDNRYAPAYFEDTDLCFRAREIGFRTVYQPKAEVIHVEGATAGTDTSSGIKKFQYINQKKFRDAWVDRLQTSHIDNERDLYIARDKSADRKIVLYIDHYVPTWDKDAGSFITMEYLKIIADLGYKIVFWPDNLTNMEPYTNTLQQMGIEVIYGNVSFSRYIKKYGKYFDVAFISRPHIAVGYVDKIVRYSTAKIIYVPHDLNFLRESRRAELENNKRMCIEVDRWKLKEFGLMKKCNTTLVFSTKEQEVVNSIDPSINIAVSPWVQAVNGSKRAYEERINLLFLGGFAHPPNEDGVLWYVREIFPLITQWLPEVGFVIAGSYPTKAIMSLQSDRISVTGFQSDVSELFHGSRVFVAPLRYGAGLKGKIIHAMSYGLPVITTEIGAEGLDLVDGNTALIASDPKQFAEKVVDVYKNKILWDGLSMASLRYVEERLSASKGRDFFSKLINETSPDKDTSV